eukprot:m.417900 g.417900  ORF g.417900 m.417900 type:complete len:463 (-) comp30667_c0_seq1:55-1443(-)
MGRRGKQRAQPEPEPAQCEPEPEPLNEQERAFVSSGAHAPPSTCTSTQVIGTTMTSRRVDEVKSRLIVLRSRREQLRREAAEIEDEIEVREFELEEVVKMPQIEGADPTRWMPDELMIAIFLILPSKMVWKGGCSLVCRRWRDLVASRPVQNWLREERWLLYEAGEIKPRSVRNGSGTVKALAMAPDGTLYSTRSNKTVVGWNPKSTSARILRDGDVDGSTGLAVAADGVIYSGSLGDVGGVRAWSGADGTLVRRLPIQANPMHRIVVCSGTGNIISSAHDGALHIWSGEDGSLVERVAGLGHIHNLAVSPTGELYVAVPIIGGAAIHVLSSKDYSKVRKLMGHTGYIHSLTCGADGSVYSASSDRSVRAWSGVDGAVLQSMSTDFQTPKCVRLGPDDRLAIGSECPVSIGPKSQTIRIWVGANGSRTLMCVIPTLWIHSLVFGPDGTLFSGCVKRRHIMAW